MKISKIYTSRMKNNAHFQFHTDIIALIEKTGAKNLGIEAQFKIYKEHFNNEDLALKKIIKSENTAKIIEADKRRDNMYIAMVTINNVSLRHWESGVVEAAKRLQIVFGTYGKINALPFREQTSAAYNILQELQGKYKSDTIKVGIIEWVEKMSEANAEVNKFTQDRYEESAVQFCGTVSDCRAEVDKAYNAIRALIEAFIIMDGTGKYGLFVKTLNIIVGTYGGKTIKQDHGLKNGGTGSNDDLPDVENDINWLPDENNNSELNEK